MTNFHSYSKNIKKDIRSQLYIFIGPILTWLIWCIVMFIYEYYNRYDGICVNSNINDFFDALGWLFVALVVLNLGFLIFLIIFYIIIRSKISKYSHKEPDGYRMALLKYLFYKTFNKVNLINGVYRIISLLFYIPIIGLSSKVIDIMRHCDLSSWYALLSPIFIIVVTISYFIYDVISLINTIRYSLKHGEENIKPTKRNFNVEI